MKLTGLRYEFNDVVVERVAAAYKSASVDQIRLAFEGFLGYVDLCKSYPDKEIPMFSKSVDEVWHNMILDTKGYQSFCENYVGYFLHHVPNSSKGVYNNKKEQESLRSLWLLACKHSGKDPYSFSETPALFDADEELHSHSNVNLLDLRLSVRMDLEKVRRSGNRTLKAKISSWFAPKKSYPINESDITYDNLLNNYILMATIEDSSPKVEPKSTQDSTPSTTLNYDYSTGDYSSKPTTSQDHYVSPSYTSPSDSSHSSRNSCSSSSHSDHSSSSHSSCSSSSSSCSSSSSSCSSSSCSS